jgi:ABC transporter substrate binding protein
MDRTADDPEANTRSTVFKQKLQELGWPEGPNLQVEVRWTAGDADHVRRYSTELVTFAPDVILAVGSPNVAAMQLASRSLPIVFVSVVDPVGVGFVDNLARPDRTPQYRRAARRRRGLLQHVGIDVAVGMHAGLAAKQQRRNMGQAFHRFPRS